MNILEIRVKASTTKISFRNVFGNTLDFVRKLWFMILLDIDSNKEEGRKSNRRGEIFWNSINGNWRLFMALVYDFGKSIQPNLAFWFLVLRA